MATYVLKNCGFFVDKYDLSGYSNSLALTLKADILDATTFGSSGYKEKVVGFTDVDGSFEGLQKTETSAFQPDKILFDNLALVDKIVVVAPEDKASGDPAFMFKSIQAEYNFGGAVGEIAKYTVTIQGKSVSVKGTIMEVGSKTSSGNSTIRELGATSLSQKLYGALQVYAFDGTSLDVSVYSDDSGTFDTPVERIAFTQATGTTAEWKEVSGPITDTYYRVSWTLVGTSASFVVALGIK